MIDQEENHEQDINNIRSKDHKRQLSQMNAILQNKRISWRKELEEKFQNMIDDKQM